MANQWVIIFLTIVLSEKLIFFLDTTTTQNLNWRNIKNRTTY